MSSSPSPGPPKTPSTQLITKGTITAPGTLARLPFWRYARHKGQLPMSRSLQSASFLARPGFRRSLALAIFSLAGFGVLLPAQTSAPAPAPSTTQATPDSLPAAPAPAAPGVRSNATSAAPVPGLFSRPSTLRQLRTPALALSAGANPFQPSPSTLAPFQSAPVLGSFLPLEGFGMGFDTVPAGFNFALPGAAPPGFGNIPSAGFSPFSTSGMGGRPGLLFPMRSGPNLSLVAGPQGFPGPAPWSLDSASESLRGNFNLPLGSSAPSFPFTYEVPFAPSGAFSSLDFRKVIATGAYTSPDLGNGVHFSAGTGYNGKSVAGVRKPAGPAVTIKLTF